MFGWAFLAKPPAEEKPWTPLRCSREGRERLLEGILPRSEHFKAYCSDECLPHAKPGVLPRLPGAFKDR
jgi:hypothetical protein